MSHITQGKGKKVPINLNKMSLIFRMAPSLHFTDLHLFYSGKKHKKTLSKIANSINETITANGLALVNKLIT